MIYDHESGQEGVGPTVRMGRRMYEVLKENFTAPQTLTVFFKGLFQFKMSKPRCWKCRAITSEFVLSEKLRGKKIVHDSFESLDESACRGCGFCALVFQQLVFTYNSTRYDEPISLTTSLGITWGSFSSCGLKWCSGECKEKFTLTPHTVRSKVAYI
jgi:hypothetical protein